MTAIAEATPPAFKPKKSVALSGVTAGNTALCTVGRTGNDLHYRGYDILDIAEVCEFEEIAHLLVHGKLPNAAELRAYKAKLKALRGLPAEREDGAGAIPAGAASDGRDAHRRLGARLRRCRRRTTTTSPGARDIADRLMASLGSMLLYWYHFASNGKRIEVETDDDTIGGHFLHLLHGKPPGAELGARHAHLADPLRRARVQRLDLHRRVIAGTGSDMYSAITGGIGALRGPKHGGANEVAFEIQKRYANPDEAEADIRRRVEAKEVVIGFGHPVYTVSRSAQHGHQGRRAAAVARTPARPEDVRHRRAARDA